MRFAACLKKDIRLLTGGGLRSLAFLILPVLLVFLMFFGMRTAAGADTLATRFDIAVRDDDNTVMSRMLISQLDRIELFNAVVRAGSKTDEELTEAGCAAVVTVPKDFFYDLYDMKDTDVVIALNADMPAEAAMVRTAFTALVGILEENQRAHYAAARVKYGDLGSEEMEEVYYEYSNAAITDALGRLDLVELSGVWEKSYDGEKLFFAASILSMLIMFIPLGVLRSVSEELDAGLSARFAVSGGSIAEAMLSKLVIAFVMTAVPVGLLIAILKIGPVLSILPALIVSFDLSFAFFLLLSVLSGKASSAQLIGNIVMLLILTLGGALYPVKLMPGIFRAAAGYLPPGVILASMQYASMGRGASYQLPRLIPLFACAMVFFLASLPFLKGRRRA
ncbi:MAG: ABC transporter permease [Clostridia bacterium]|nr:ABC transporter permease [Clostridia bacterium]